MQSSTNRHFTYPIRQQSKNVDSDEDAYDYKDNECQSENDAIAATIYYQKEKHHEQALLQNEDSSIISDDLSSIMKGKKN